MNKFLSILIGTAICVSACAMELKAQDSQRRRTIEGRPQPQGWEPSPRFDQPAFDPRDETSNRRPPGLDIVPVSGSMSADSHPYRIYQDPLDPMGQEPLIPPMNPGPSIGMQQNQVEDPSRFNQPFSSDSNQFGVGVDLYSPPDFEGGLIVYGENVAMKLGGYVKADFIYDFDAIDQTDSFVTTSIPFDAAPRTNSRYHARQTRLSFDTRWATDKETVRVFFEGDFFSDGNNFRLRHAYGESGEILVGQTWTTFTDVAAAPATLDFEGSVSAVNRRQAQLRWTRPIITRDITFALAIEDTRFIIVPPPNIVGTARSPSPDLVARIRISKPWGQFQVAQLYRVGGFQADGLDLVTTAAWGYNCTGVIPLSAANKAYYQVVFGQGIGSYRGLPDAAPESATQERLLGLLGWMVGVTHDWRDDLSSNLTYGENRLDNAALQMGTDVHRTTYLAVNLIWTPLDRVKVGMEYLYGLRENVNRTSRDANRVQVAFIFDLP